jgi:hypothetical protein
MQYLFPSNLVNEKRRKFWGHLSATGVLPRHHLVRVIRDKSYSALLRSAALRNLTCIAPLEVTQGQPYAQRRRLVRKHYNV